MMDYIRVFEVELDKTVYYAGETLSGHVYLEVEENMRLQNIKILMRGKAHTEWKITRAGERRTMKQDETYLEEKMLLWGKEDSDSAHGGVPILTRGRHHYPFNFQIPDSALPCSFESKIGTIRYYVRVNINIPYASCPQSIQHFTIIGPRLDCMDERYLIPVQALAKRNSCSLCCGKGPLVLRASMDRTSYMCGEQIRLKAEIQNGSDTEVWVICKLVQYVEFFINKGVLGLTKEVRHTVLEAQSDKVSAHDASCLDELMGRLTVPVMPPTLEDACSLIQIYYTLKLYMDTPKGKGDTAEICFPVTICTMPYRDPNAPPPELHFDSAAPNVEGGMYVSTEFQLGQVYMGDEADPETDQTILYRPVYMCTKSDITESRSDTHLLQVPPRQTCRSRENIRLSREGLHMAQQENMAASQTVPLNASKVSENVEGAKGGKSRPEDKFLLEITAKIANRQFSEDGDLKEGIGTNDSKQIDVDTHVDMMRKQKQSNDFVHKALVNELRRHLSDADDTTPAVKGPGLKKVSGVKKVSETTITSQTEQGKRLKTETETDMIVAIQDTISYTSPANKPESHIQDVELELETTESTALLPDDRKHDESMMDTSTRNKDITESSPLLSQSETNTIDGISMQQTLECSSSVPHSEIISSTVSREKTTHISTEIIHSDSSGSGIQSMNVDTTSSPKRLSSTMIGEGPFDSTRQERLSTVPDPKPRSPKVIPKPRPKDRYSMPMPQLTAEGSELGGISIESTRPKSEFVEQRDNFSSHTDSTA